MSKRDAHLCHVRSCDTPCRPEHLMCREHWALVPLELRIVVEETYRPGQCNDKRPSRAWALAARAAIKAVEARND